MSDIGRQSITDKVGGAVKPDPAKTATASESLGSGLLSKSGKNTTTVQTLAAADDPVPPSGGNDTSTSTGGATNRDTATAGAATGGVGGVGTGGTGGAATGGAATLLGGPDAEPSEDTADPTVDEPGPVPPSGGDGNDTSTETGGATNRDTATAGAATGGAGGLGTGGLGGEAIGGEAKLVATGANCDPTVPTDPPSIVGKAKAALTSAVAPQK